MVRHFATSPLEGNSRAPQDQDSSSGGSQVRLWGSLGEALGKACPSQKAEGAPKVELDVAGGG